MPTADRGLRVSGLSARAGAFTLGPVSLDVPADRVRPVTFRRIREPSGRQPSEIAPTQVPFAASR